VKPRRREIIIAPTGSTSTQTAACASCAGAITRRAFDLTISPQARTLTTFVTGYEVGEFDFALLTLDGHGLDHA
jgi:hypothetical protein